ncbi:MAG: hypothetical protein ACM3WV_01410 [Bacillota bacterium]
MAQFAGLIGLGPYFPWAIPGIHSMGAQTEGMRLGAASYVILFLISFAGLAATFAWRRFADQT